MKAVAHVAALLNEKYTIFNHLDENKGKKQNYTTSIMIKRIGIYLNVEIKFLKIIDIDTAVRHIAEVL